MLEKLREGRNKEKKKVREGKIRLGRSGVKRFKKEYVSREETRRPEERWT